MTHPSSELVARAQQVKRWAYHEGFELVGIAPAGPIPCQDKLRDWVKQGYYAEMDWIANTLDQRCDPRALVPEARSVIALGMNYFQRVPPQPPGTLKISCYAWGRDYHRVLRSRLKRIAQRITDQFSGAQVLSSVDTSPVAERSWAAQAGLGWVGKNGLLIHQPRVTGEPGGSYFFLATLISSLELAYDQPVQARCGTCTRCLTACPTGAFVQEGMIDCRRCLAYLTIENRQQSLPFERENYRDWVFGCDECQAVCPWNRFAASCEKSEFIARAGQVFISPSELEQLSQESFAQRFAGTSLMRARYEGLMRNLCKLYKQEL